MSSRKRHCHHFPSGLFWPLVETAPQLGNATLHRRFSSSLHIRLHRPDAAKYDVCNKLRWSPIITTWYMVPTT